MDNYSYITYSITYEQAIDEIAKDVQKNPSFKNVDMQVIKNKSEIMLLKKKFNNTQFPQFSWIGWVTYKREIVEAILQDFMLDILDYLSNVNSMRDTQVV